jgi:hypothetical protein
MNSHSHLYREKNERERYRDGETERRREREKERQRDKETERQRDRETERQRDRETMNSHLWREKSKHKSLVGLNLLNIWEKYFCLSQVKAIE